MKKKILHISTYYLPQFGGIEQVAYDIVDVLKDNFENKVVCFSETQKSFVDFYDGIEITRVGYIKKVASQAISLEYYFQLRDLIEKYKPDYIHIHLPNPLVTVYLDRILKKESNKNIKVIVHWHSDIVKQKNLLKMYRMFEEKFLNKSYKIIATSLEYAKNSETINKYMDKIEIIPNIVDESIGELSNDNYRNIEEIRKKYKDKKIIFFLGVHREYKGLKHLIGASKYLDDSYKIVIAGAGPLTNELKELAKDDKKIEFLGKISVEEKKEYLHASDIFGFPSITKNEAFGVALAEALYCGLPAVTFKIEGSGVNWVNQNKLTGIEVENQNNFEYAEAIKKIEKNYYTDNCKKWIVNNFTKEKITKKLVEIYS
ncbi:glycosyltransferase [Cetobacterium sp. 2A]|uniref:glycosyltransferase n=1 Tax=Cetobacterium sp. 2A TaxID=2754723 RepID=UPI00163CB834|nr:glycosyltransferase [Cetobacterium sp. 2A]MBC2856166.1 glycosyltransferase [Cetobacterium sp. 2A]